MNDRQWATFVAGAGIQADRNAKTFTPLWDEFSADPSGEISYHDFGAIVMIWTDALTIGTSNGVTLTWGSGSVPEAIRPSATRLVRCNVIDSGSSWAGNAAIATDGSVIFSLETVSGTQITSANNVFTNVGNKGLPSGFLLVFAK